jgi:uncharacterized Fe-S cluster-containing MiaB family protein
MTFFNFENNVYRNPHIFQIINILSNFRNFKTKSILVQNYYFLIFKSMV